MPQKDIGLHLIEDTKVLCKNGKIIIPTSLWHRASSWYHHYLQHPGHLHLEKTMRSMMYWKGMRTTIRRYVKICQSCQVNKRHSQKYGHLPPKLVIITPWKALCVDLIGPYVTPHMVTNSFQERAVPIWEIFVFPNGDPHMVTGIPV